uniref:Uncharacterized protein n=1 Tax=Panagrolaimus davidi TaxID=227884 RepID=A0A914QEN7_9BILA
MEEYHPDQTFREILEKSPILERIDIRRPNIEVSNLWPEDLLRLNRAENLYYIHLNVPDLNFDTESLVALLKVRTLLIEWSSG